MHPERKEGLACVILPSVCQTHCQTASGLKRADAYRGGVTITRYASGTRYQLCLTTDIVAMSV